MIVKQDIRNKIVGSTAKAKKNGKVYNGIIQGRLLDFPVFHSYDGNFHIEITWPLAYRAVYENTIILAN